MSDFLCGSEDHCWDRTVCFMSTLHAYLIVRINRDRSLAGIRIASLFLGGRMVSATSIYIKQSRSHHLSNLYSSLSRRGSVFNRLQKDEII